MGKSTISMAIFNQYPLNPLVHPLVQRCLPDDRSAWIPRHGEVSWQTAFPNETPLPPPRPPKAEREGFIGDKCHPR